MELKNINTNLAYRIMERGEDTDYFIETLSYPIIFEIPIPFMSRIQFPKSRVVLVRTSNTTTNVTLHIMRDIDLHSSFANYEMDLEGKELNIKKNDNCIKMFVTCK